jgi:hypothetical protein
MVACLLLALSAQASQGATGARGTEQADAHDSAHGAGHQVAMEHTEIKSADHLDADVLQNLETITTLVGTCKEGFEP